MKNNPNVKRFIKELKLKCKESGIRLYLSKGKYVKVTKSIRAGGYFMDDSFGQTPTLACAIGMPISKWLPLLVHESCHLDQWVEGDKLWTNSNIISVVDEWLDGKEIHPATLRKAFKASKAVELDCEKRSLKKIKAYNLPLDSKTYIQKANAYVLFYNYVLKYRKWSKPGNPPYNDNIWPHAPSVWLSNYDNIPKRLEYLYDAHLGLK